MIISRRSRQKFADLAAAAGTVATIEDVYEAHDFRLPEGFVGPESGIRRAICTAIEDAADLSDPAVSDRLLRVYIDAIEDWGWSAPWLPTDGEETLSDLAKALVRALQNDDAPITDQGRLTYAAGPVTLPVDNLARLDAPQVLHEHLRRINDSIVRDPAAAIGSAKELIESTFKIVLDDYGVTYDRSNDLLDLYKLVASELRLTRESVPDSAKGSRASHKILSNLTTTVQNLAELRNELGLGHGRAASSKALSRHARLAGDAAQTIANFVLATWHERRAAATTTTS